MKTETERSLHWGWKAVYIVAMPFLICGLCLGFAARLAGKITEVEKEENQ